jgi:hypothetical protein
MNKDSKYVNMETLIFTFHTLFLDYTGGAFLMNLSIYDPKKNGPARALCVISPTFIH